MKINISINKTFIKKLKKITSITTAVSVLIYTMGISAFAGSERENVNTLLKGLLEKTYVYGVTANTVNVANDFESNFAADTFLVSGTKDIGTSVVKYTNAAGNIYFNHFTEGVLQLRAAANIVVGDEFSKSNTTYSFASGAQILAANASSVNVIKDADYMDVTKSITEVGDNFSAFTTESDNVVVNLSDMNNGIINTTNSDSQIVVVNLDYNSYKNLQQGGLKITKDEDQILIMNVKNVEDTTAYISRYSVNGVSTAEEVENISKTVVWNFSNYQGDISLSEFSGILIATKAYVKVDRGTSRGRVVADKFINTNGEWHFLASDIENETTTEATTTEVTTTEETTEVVTSSETTSETTKVDETTTMQETTKVDETTTTEETTTEETTTVAETTVAETTTVETTTEETTTVETTTEETTTVVETTNTETTTMPVTTTEEATTVVETTNTETTTIPETTTVLETTKVVETTTDSETITTEDIPLDDPTTTNQTTKVFETTSKEATTVDEGKVTKETTTIDQGEIITTERIPLDNGETKTTKTKETTKETTKDEGETISEIIPLDGPQTGDSRNYVLYIALAAASLVGIVFVYRKKDIVE